MDTAVLASNGRFSVGRAWFAVIAFGLIIALPYLFLTELQSGDETRVAGIAAEMLIDHDFLVPRLGGKPFLEYPPLCYQLMAGSFRLFGVNDAAARLPSVLFALGGMILTFLFGLRIKLSPGFAALGAILLGSSAQYYGNTGKCTVDMQLAFFIELAVYAFYGFTGAATRRSKAAWLLLALLGFTGGIYTKGLLGVALPGAVLGFWVFAGDLRDRRFSLLRYVLLALLGIAALALALLWYRHVYLTLGEDACRETLLTQNFGRFSGRQGDHVTPWYYYLTKLPELFQPYLLILLPSLWYGVRQRRNKEADGILLATVFVLLPFVLLSISASKRIVYLLMLAAPAALCCAVGCRALAERLPARFRSARFAALPPAGKTACALGGALLLAVGNLIYNFSIESESLRPCFERCRELEAQGVRVKLVRPPERTVGAASYYLLHLLPQLEGRQTAVPGPGEAFLTRTRKPAPGVELFADRHCIQLGPNVPKTAADLTQPSSNKGQKL